MTYPIPKYKGSIQPSSVRGVDLAKESTAISVYEAFGRYMGEKTYIFHKSSLDRSNRVYSYDQFSGITPDSIIIQSSAETKMSSEGFHTERVPIAWGIEIFSFAKPVDKVKENLVQIIKKAAKKLEK